MTNYPHQQFGGQTWSQHGEDMVLACIVTRLECPFDRVTYVDIGAHDPWALSNTALLYQRGARGVLVEANPHLIGRLRSERPEDVVLCTAVLGSAEPRQRVTLHRAGLDSGVNSTLPGNLRSHGIADTVSVDAITLSQIVDKHLQGRWPDILSIDAEGRDLEILQSADMRAVSIICIEAVSQIGDDTRRIRDWCARSGFQVLLPMGGNLILVNDTIAGALH
jgi:FkbM family methyltransferase